jgi:hypothetical protein
MKTSAFLSSVLAALVVSFASAKPSAASLAPKTIPSAGEYILKGFDTSGIPEAVYWELKQDLDWCGSPAASCGRRAFRVCVRGALYDYEVPAELTYAEKRWVRREAREYALAYYPYENSC